MESYDHMRKDLGHIYEGQIEGSQELASGICQSACQEEAKGLPRSCWDARKSALEQRIVQDDGLHGGRTWVKTEL